MTTEKGQTMAYDSSVFEARRRAAMQNIAAPSAMNVYDQFISQQRGQRNLADLQRQYNEGAPRVVAGYGRRGLLAPSVKSGAFRKAMAEYARKRVEDTSALQRELDMSAAQAELQNRQLRSQYAQDLQDLETDKARQIREDALALLRLRAGA